MQKITASFKRGKVEISLPTASLPLEELQSRVNQLLPVLAAILEADTICDQLDAQTASKRHTAIAARDLIYQYKVYEASEAARLIGRIASGEESIANHGFPEFGSDETIGV